MNELQEEYLMVVKYDVKSFVDLVYLKSRLQYVDEELCKAQKEMYRDRASQKRSCKTAEDLEFFEASEDDYRERLEQIKLQKKDNQKKLKAVERCLKRDGSMLDAELEYRIPVDDMVDLAEVEKDGVPGNPYRVQEELVAAELIVESSVEPVIEYSAEPTEGVAADDIVAEVEVGAASVVTNVRAVADTVVADNAMAVVADSNAAEDTSVGLEMENDEVQVAGKLVKLPDNKADYMRMSVAEKVSCYPFDDKGTDAAFEMVKAYFEKISMDTSFNSVYDEAKFLTDYYEKQKAEEFIGERAEQVIGAMKWMGVDAGRFAEYPADVLSEVFDFGDMEYFAGLKLFNKVIDRLGVEIERQRRYEVFDRIYEEGMREKKVERSRKSR